MNESDITTRYGRLHCYKKGNGAKVVLLLHGSGCDNAMLSWREVFSAFGEDFTVYAFDLLGYGKSDHPDDLCGAEFYQKHISSINQAVSFLSLGRFALAGLSMGGAIAIGYALAYPQSVSLLLPVDSWGLSKKLPMHSLSYWMIHKTNFTLSQYRLLVKSRFLAKWSISYSLIGDKKFITDSLVDEVICACKGDNAGRSMLDYQRSSCSKKGSIPYYGERLSQLACPVVFVNGEKDPLVPLRDMLAAIKMTNHAEYAVFKGCKHWSVKEKPREFVSIVQKYFVD